MSVATDHLDPRRIGEALEPPAIRPGTAGAVVAAHLTEHLQRLLELDDAVRADEPDAVHQMRVATRRLRSAMATFRPTLARTVTDPFRDELKWLGSELGPVRDAEVQRDRLRDRARALDPDLLLGPVLDRIDTELHRRHETAHEHLLVALEDDRYRDLRATAITFIGAPPLDGIADRSERRLAEQVEKACRRVERAAAAADPEVTDHAGIVALHELRKAAKRARYAGEAVAGTFGKRAARLAQRMEDLQEALGEHQDSVDARATLRQLGVTAHLSGENGFSFGVLHGLEAMASSDALAEVDHLARRATHRPAKASLR
jgi:CHAD domain-containing protein